MRWCCAVVFLVLVPQLGCATAPLPSRAAFSEQILDPLADKRAGEMIGQWKADARLRAANAQGHDWVFSLLDLGSTYVTGIPGAGSFLRTLKGNPQAKLEQYEMWLDTRRAPTKAKLLTIYESRINEQDGGRVFAVCEGGRERRYDRAAGFSRLDDGPGPCPTVNLSPTNQ